MQASEHLKQNGLSDLKSCLDWSAKQDPKHFDKD